MHREDHRGEITIKHNRVRGLIHPSWRRRKLGNVGDSGNRDIMIAQETIAPSVAPHPEGQPVGGARGSGRGVTAMESAHRHWEPGGTQEGLAAADCLHRKRQWVIWLWAANQVPPHRLQAGQWMLSGQTLQGQVRYLESHPRELPQALSPNSFLPGMPTPWDQEIACKRFPLALVSGK